MSNIQYKMLVAEIANHQCTFLSSMYVPIYPCTVLITFYVVIFLKQKQKCSQAWHRPGEMTEGTRTVDVIKELGYTGLYV